MSGRIVVVYDEGSVSPMELLAGLCGSFAAIDLWVTGSDHVGVVMPVLEQIGSVSPIDGWRAAAAANPPSAITTFSERMIVRTAEIAEGLQLPFHTRDVAKALTDKVRQRSLLARNGVESIRYHPVVGLETWLEAVACVGLPAVLKPRIGEASRDTYLIVDETEGRRIVEDLTSMGGLGAEFILEEYLQGHDSGPFGDYVSVESIVDEGHVTHLSVTGKFPLLPPFRETGAFWPAAIPTETHREVTELTMRALAALGVRRGVTHTEIKLTTSGPRLIEVNGRIGGHINELSRRATNTDLVTIAGALAACRPVQLTPVQVSGVHFQYFNSAPIVPSRMVSMGGISDVGRLPQISAYKLYVRPGDLVPGGPQTHILDLVAGHVETHDELMDVIQTALDRLSFTFEGSEGVFDHPPTAVRRERAFGSSASHARRRSIDAG